VFYTAELAVLPLLGALVPLGVFAVLVQRRVRSWWLLLPLAFATWALVHASGVHATVAGVLLAMTIPAQVRIAPRAFLDRGRGLLLELERASAPGTPLEASPLMNAEQLAAIHTLQAAAADAETPLQRLEHALHTWVAFVIVPLFALANAGVALAGADLAAAATHPVTLGVAAGLVLGKQAGITFFTWLATRTGLAALPQGVTWRHVYGAGWLGGIGFTMSLFIANLAFAAADGPSGTDGAALLAVAKVGILLASLVAGGAGWLILHGGRAAAAGAAPPGPEDGAASRGGSSAA
jgi:NhaA family Na+:H+ antiporter